MLQILSVFVYVLLVLEYAIQSGYSMPTSATSSWCNCIRAKDCVAYKTQLLNSRMDQLRDVIERIRNAGCGFTALSEPMLCCPTTMETYDFTSHHSISMNDRWVWERRAKPNDENENDKNENRFISTNLIDDYVDWKTHRNCPPILYKETNFDFHKKFRDHKVLRDDHEHDLHRFHHYPPHHFDFDEHIQPHEFHFHTPHHNHFDDEDYESNKDDNPHSESRHEFWPVDVSKPQQPHSDDRPETTTGTARIPSTTTTESAPITPPTVNTPNCGVTLNKRIIGGIEALPGEFPWITRIAYLNQTDNSIAYRCSGSFISETHILTAAHCVTNLDASLNLSHISLVRLNISDGASQESPDIFQIAETIVHPNYDSPRRANDIAIIKINKPPNAESNYGTICLPSTNVTNYSLIGSTGIVAGWSNNEGTETNDLRVRYLRLGIMNNTVCADSYNTFREGFAEKITIISSMVCTQGQANGSDVCRGDSGGPLMDDGSSAMFNREGRYTLLGIVAFGPICGLTNLLPGVYMRVSEYVDWIVSNVK